MQPSTCRKKESLLFILFSSAASESNNRLISSAKSLHPALDLAQTGPGNENIADLFPVWWLVACPNGCQLRLWQHGMLTGKQHLGRGRTRA